MSGPAQVTQVLWRGDDTPPLVWGFGALARYTLRCLSGGHTQVWA